MSASVGTPRPPQSLGETLFRVVLVLAGVAVVLIGVFHAAVVVVAWVSGHPVPALRETFRVWRHAPGDPIGAYAVSPGSPVAVWVVFGLLVAALVVGGFWLAVVIGRGVVDRRTGRATPHTLRVMSRRVALRDAHRMLAATAAVAPGAGRRGLRRRQPGVERRLLVPLASLRGRELFAQHEDSMLVLCMPRMGKTSAFVVPRILGAPGPVVVTGTKNDVLFLTAAFRETVGQVLVLDVADITGWPTPLRWDPVAGCADPDEALARGRAWAAAAPTGDTTNGSWFAERAGEVLAYLFHAAALKPGGSMRDVARWAADFTLAEPATILRDRGTTTTDADPRTEIDTDFGTHTWADLLTTRTQSRAGETVDALRMTLSGVLAPLTSPRVLRAVCPTKGDRVLDVATFLDGRNTLYLLSGQGTSTVAPLITALVDQIVRTAKAKSQTSPGGRLWPPLALVLEEAANVAPLPDLPALMSDSGGRGISVAVVVQSRAQMALRWGRDGAAAIEAAATCRLYLPGIGEQDVLDELSTKTGRYRASKVAVSSGRAGGSVSTSTEWEPVMTDEQIRQMAPGTALLVYRNLPAAHVKMRRWWERSDAKAVRAGLSTIQDRTGRTIDA